MCHLKLLSKNNYNYDLQVQFKDQISIKENEKINQILLFLLKFQTNLKVFLGFFFSLITNLQQNPKCRRKGNKKHFAQ